MTINPKGVDVIKGQFMQQCYRTVCNNPKANFYNSSTKRYYCKHCAKRINLVNDQELCIKHDADCKKY